MKLIATLGATKSVFEHIYKIENKEYKKKVSFLALKEHFNISNENVFIIGTEQTKENLKEIIKDFNFLKINQDSIEEIFKTILNCIDKDSILDFTQGFRMVPFGGMLALNVSKTLKKEAKDIFYALVEDNCIPAKTQCNFKFISLKKYDEISDLARTINNFVKSWYVERIELEIFKDIHKALHKLSQKILINDLNINEEVSFLRKKIKESKIKELSFLQKHLELLEIELNDLHHFVKLREHQKFYRFSKKAYKKNLLLQSTTLLFESIMAYLEYITPSNINKCVKYGKEINKSNAYKWRNCLKSNLSKKNGCNSNYFKNLQNCKEFRKKLKELDEIRNNSAHVFINGENYENIKQKLGELLNFFSKYMN